MSKTPLIIAHRGSSSALPENTLEAFNDATQKHKVDMIEFDLHMTKDGVPIIIHDAYVNRTTQGRGPVSHKTLEEIKTLDAGYFFDPLGLKEYPFRGKGIKVPSFEEFLATKPPCELALELKVKSKELIEKLLALLKKHNYFDRTLMGSKYDYVACQLKEISPHMRRLSSMHEVYGHLQNYYTKKDQGVPCPNLALSMPTHRFGIPLNQQGFIHYLHEKSIKVYYWTINDEASMQLLADRGADGLMSDYPEILCKVFRGQKT